MSGSSLRVISPRRGGPASRFALSLSGAVLALALVSAPASADPPPSPGKSGDTPARTGSVPAPAHAAAHQHAANGLAHAQNNAPAPHPQGPPAGVPQGPPDGVPPGPPDGVPGGGGDTPGDTPGEPPKETGAQKVVVCKYVRKPGVAEVFSHVIVVDDDALLGKGFAGKFPFPFSDGQIKSVAIRFAADGEHASQIDVSVCTASTPPAEEPPAEEPPVEQPPAANPPVEQPPPGEAGGIVEDAPAATTGALPQTGAPANLLVLLALSGVGTLGGAWLVGRGRRVRPPLA